MTLNYDVKGRGEPIVLLHGLFGSLENLGVIARQLAGEYQVISIDLPDHGKSPFSDTFSFEHYAQSVAATLQSIEVSQVNLLGHSLGGKVAMHLALSQPSLVKRLMVADIAPVQYSPRHQNVFNGLQNVDLAQINSRQQADKLMAEFIMEPGVRQFLLKSLYKQDDGSYAWRFNLDLLIRDYAILSQAILGSAPYRARTLFIKGGNSDYITRDHQPAIGALFPHAEAKVINGTGHWLHAEKPNVFAGIVSRFLEDSD
ncbi:alpha/beta fold hydrolase [Planctobacterium marinum]|uniref:alpha/beta fold hydrolase n=1 Tax=Planctobacterium marinum TaxID=1631968 RepID=UPI001E3B0F08|nr:alpha/beta fold hydrolase [Planctobacterium marinum]MCC2604293.1 alpha/beta fold hydrolase [Planctobacterium marinum]